MDIFLIILLLILRPDKGWKSINKLSLTNDEIMAKCFYPLMGLMAISAVACDIYKTEFNLSSSLQHAIVELVMYYGGLILGIYIFKEISKALQIEINSIKIDRFFIFSMAIMMIIAIVANIVPTGLILMDLAPLYLVIIIIMAQKYIGIATEKRTIISIISSILIIIVPFTISYLIKLILPNQV